MGMDINGDEKMIHNPSQGFVLIFEMDSNV